MIRAQDSIPYWNIPDRQGINKTEEDEDYYISKECQFLIGNVSTLQNLANQLINMLKPCKCQFLIGNVSTKAKKWSATEADKVSIPDRECINVNGDPNNFYEFKLCQFLIGNVSTDLFAGRFEVKLVNSVNS